MARAKQMYDWDRTSAVLAMIAETVRDHRRRSEPFRPDEFHPLRHPAADADVIEIELLDLKPMFKKQWGH